MIELSFSILGTRYPEINRKITRFINKRKEFPDYQDIRKLIVKTNKSKGLNLRYGIVVDRTNKSKGLNLRYGIVIVRTNKSKGLNLRYGIVIVRTNKSKGLNLRYGIVVDRTNKSKGLNLRYGIVIVRTNKSKGLNLRYGIVIVRTNKSKGLNLRYGIVIVRTNKSKGCLNLRYGIKNGKVSLEMLDKIFYMQKSKAHMQQILFFASYIVQSTCFFILSIRTPNLTKKLSATIVGC